ncbi:MAG: dephospho-CoA kinase [Treponema sp.]|nr:dephospho-CoA kinase [Treponema sp.]
MTVCVTGQMAAGKNYVSEILCGMGFVSVDADVLAHEAVDLCTDRILEEFSSLAESRGIALADSDGKIIRRNLGALIFTDPALVKRQEDIVFPKITSMLESFLEEHSGENVVVNATVLYKLPIISRMDRVIYVEAPMPIRFLRAKKRDSLPARQILDRFKRQENLFAKYKISNADTLKVRNTGSRKSLEKRLKRILFKESF